MKKICLFILCLLLSQVGSVKAFEVEARGAYFIPQDHRIRDFFDHGFGEWEVEVAAPLNFNCLCGFDLEAFINFSYYDKSGHSKFKCETCSSCSQMTDIPSCLDSNPCGHKHKVKVTNWALNFGLKHYFDLCQCGCGFERFHPYVGFGLGFDRVKFNNHSHFVKRHQEKTAFALLAKSGIKYDLTCNFFIDIFADYAWSHFRFHSKRSEEGCVKGHSLNVGGWKFGGGIGFCF